MGDIADWFDEQMDYPDLHGKDDYQEYVEEEARQKKLKKFRKGLREFIRKLKEEKREG